MGTGVHSSSLLVQSGWWVLVGWWLGGVLVAMDLLRRLLQVDGEYKSNWPRDDIVKLTRLAFSVILS
jgi:hypothetical protein